MRDREFLIWLHARLVEVHKEPPEIDYMLKLGNIIANYPKDNITPNTSINIHENPDLLQPEGE